METQDIAFVNSCTGKDGGFPVPSKFSSVSAAADTFVMAFNPAMQTPLPSLLDPCLKLGSRPDKETMTPMMRSYGMNAERLSLLLSLSGKVSQVEFGQKDDPSGASRNMPVPGSSVGVAMTKMGM